MKKKKKGLEDKLVEECTENIDERRLVEINSTEHNSIENIRKHNSCTLHMVLLSIFFTVNVGIGSYFLYFHWNFKKDAIRVNNLMKF